VGRTNQLARPTGTTQPKTHVARPAPEQRPTNQRNSGSPNSGTAAFTERDIHSEISSELRKRFAPLKPVPFIVGLVGRAGLEPATNGL
jgi:hypothetical protein